MKIYIVLIILLTGSTTPITARAQNDRSFIRRGNEQFQKGNFDKAEVEYRRAIAKNDRNPQALYNLGCALMAQQKDSDAVEQFQNAGKIQTAPARRAGIYHNIGVLCQRHKLYNDAIEAYKESLRNNPADEQTRYNLALCQRQRKNTDRENQENKQQPNKNDNKKQEKNNEQQQRQMSKDNAEQLLNAAVQQEKETQQKLKRNNSQSRSRQLKKNW